MKVFCSVLALGLTLTASLAIANSGKALTKRSAAASLPVFPEAQGFGTNTPAGRGGKVIIVTTLADSGPGSIREAVATKGPRTILFAVGGTIDLQNQPLIISEPYVTIAGQSAPSPGINLISQGIQVKNHDVLIQHLRVRGGDRGKKEFDGINAGADNDTKTVYNVVIDHCSFAWAIDENASVSGSLAGTPHDITYSNSIISEGLANSYHSKGEHSKGTLINNGAKNVALIGNLYAHNNDRNPGLKSNTSTVVVNNLIYNPGNRSIWLGGAPNSGGTTPLVSSVVGNRMISGPSSKSDIRFFAYEGYGFSVFQSDNLPTDRNGNSLPLYTGSFTFLSQKPIWIDGLKVRPANTVKDWVLANAGARPANQDSVDKRVIASVLQGTGQVIDSQQQVGGYPVLTPTQRTPQIPADPNGDEDGDGYTNLEEWLQTESSQVAVRSAATLRSLSRNRSITKVQPTIKHQYRVYPPKRYPINSSK